MFSPVNGLILSLPATVNILLYGLKHVVEYLGQNLHKTAEYFETFPKTRNLLKPSQKCGISQNLHKKRNISNPSQYRVIFPKTSQNREIFQNLF